MSRNEKNRLSRLKSGDILIRNSGLIGFQYVEDYPDGNLSIAEATKKVPFKIKRAYWINKLHHREAVRGRHAHKKLEQVIICVNGSFRLLLDDGQSKQSILMDTPYRGLRLGPFLWHEMSGFSQDCVILVLASDYFQEADYIRDYQEFLRLAATKSLRE